MSTNSDVLMEDVPVIAVYPVMVGGRPEVGKREIGGRKAIAAGLPVHVKVLTFVDDHDYASASDEEILGAAVASLGGANPDPDADWTVVGGTA